MNSSSGPVETPDDPGSATSEASVFEFEDYHIYLRAWAAIQRQRKKGFSFQVLANRAGLKSRSFLRLVTLGQRDLLHATAVKISKAMGHTERESEFFLALVGFNNASSPEERGVYLKKLQAIGKPRRRKILSVQEYEFFSKWYIIPIWELVAVVPFGNDFCQIADRLEPRITEEEARHAVRILLELDLIKPSGALYARCEENLHTREEIVSKAIKSYQKETMELGQRALEYIPKEMRQIRTLTVGLDEARWNRLKMLVQEFQQQIVDLTTEVPEVDRVYQINLQAFPLTRLFGSRRSPLP